MSLEPFEVIPDMFELFGLQYHEDVDTFLKVTDMVSLLQLFVEQIVLLKNFCT